MNLCGYAERQGWFVQKQREFEEFSLHFHAMHCIMERKEQYIFNFTSIEPSAISQIPSSQVKSTS